MLKKTKNCFYLSLKQAIREQKVRSIVSFYIIVQQTSCRAVIV